VFRALRGVAVASFPFSWMVTCRRLGSRLRADAAWLYALSTPLKLARCFHVNLRDPLSRPGWTRPQLLSDLGRAPVAFTPRALSLRPADAGELRPPRWSRSMRCSASASVRRPANSAGEGKFTVPAATVLRACAARPRIDLAGPHPKHARTRNLGGRVVVCPRWAPRSRTAATIARCALPQAFGHVSLLLARCRPILSSFFYLPSANSLYSASFPLLSPTLLPSSSTPRRAGSEGDPRVSDSAAQCALLAPYLPIFSARSSFFS